METHTKNKECIHLYIRKGSRNGIELVILLEELELQYTLHAVTNPEEISDKSFTYIDIHTPLPILTDVHPSGQRFRLQECGAIAQYLISRYDTAHKLSYPSSTPEYLQVNAWLFFLTSRLGPSHEEAVHFSLEAQEKIPYGISRFTDKTLQLYLVLERHLQDTKMGFIVDGKCTVADIAHVPYIAGADLAGISIDQFPALKSWYERMLQRPAVVRGLGALEQNEPCVA